VFARGAKAEEAKAAGADVVGAEDRWRKCRPVRSISTVASPLPT
jgi:ribosomal protein L1